MMYYQLKISACRKLRGRGGGSVSMQKIEQNDIDGSSGGGGVRVTDPLGPSHQQAHQIILTCYYLTKCFEF